MYSSAYSFLLMEIFLDSSLTNPVGPSSGFLSFCTYFPLSHLDSYLTCLLTYLPYWSTISSGRILLYSLSLSRTVLGTVSGLRENIWNKQQWEDGLCNSWTIACVKTQSPEREPGKFWTYWQRKMASNWGGQMWWLGGVGDWKEELQELMLVS